METNKNIRKPVKQKHWLTAFEVCRLLHISPGVLQNLYSNGLLTATNTRRTVCYAWEDIQSLIETEGGKA